MDDDEKTEEEKKVRRLTASQRSVSTLIMVILVAVVINHFYNPDKPAFDIGGTLNGTASSTLYGNTTNNAPGAASVNSNVLARSFTATKTGNLVNVSIERSNASDLVFAYEEPFEKNNSGNSWSALPASPALSPDKKLLAYCDLEGLKVMDIVTGRKTNVRAHKPGRIINGEEEPVTPMPGQQISTLDRCVLPLWSPNNRYILYTQVPYESRAYGVVDILQNKFKDSIVSGSVDDMKWASNNNSKLYIEYTSTPAISGDIYNAPYGTYRAEISSVDNIIFIKI